MNKIDRIIALLKELKSIEKTLNEDEIKALNKALYKKFKVPFDTQLNYIG